MATRNPNPKLAFTLKIWARSALSILFALVVGFILIQINLVVLGVIITLLALFMAWWVSPLRKGTHQSLTAALAERTKSQAIVLWAPTSKRSSQLQIGILPSDPKFKWVNFFFDDAAQYFALQVAQKRNPEATKAEAYNLLPIIIFADDQIITQATAGAVKDACK